MKQILPFQKRGVEGDAEDERRRKPRISYPIPIKVRGVDNCGESFEFDTVADDLSAGGFSAHTTQELLPGQNLFVVIHFSLAQSHPRRAPVVAAHGTVSRIVKQQNGSYKFATKMRLYRFL